MLELTSTLRSIALEQPTTIRVFERYHLDYCCGGKRSLAEACAATGLDAQEVLSSLEFAIEKENRQDANENFTQVTLTALIRHILEKHHAYVKAELPRLQALGNKVIARHGAHHPEVSIVAQSFDALAKELLMHLHKEEMILFPYIESLERQGGSQSAHEVCFGSIQSPIGAMVAEHESAGSLLESMRSASANFAPPEGACPTYVGLYDGLAAFERDLHQHIHLENNLLFPRAVALEKEMLAAF